jgi:1,2-diacylglycerol-3-alpha-glucose alpha-1,2-glucosyltransferase
MKALVYFNPGSKADCFAATRLRKNIKGSLELADVVWVESLFALPELLHLLSPEDEAKMHDAKLDGLKVVVSALYTEMDPAARYFQQDPDGFYRLRGKAERLLEGADLILVPCEGAKEALVEAGIKNPHFAILSAGVNMARFERSDPVETGVVYRYLRFPEGSKYVFSVGDYEDIEVLAKFDAVAKACPKIRFFFAGVKRGITSDATIKKLNKNASGNCRYLDLLEDDVFRSAMVNASVFLSFPSPKSDQILALEAMASKTQIICFGKPLLGDVIEEKKTAYCYSSAEKVAKAIESYCALKLTPTIIEGYRKAKSCSLDKVGQQLKAMYESLLKGSEE